ncbi:unnamed protein product, partial [Rotaria sp. Silwood1]
MVYYETNRARLEDE